MKNLILLIGLLSTPLCFSAENPNKKIRIEKEKTPIRPIRPCWLNLRTILEHQQKVSFSQSCKKHDGVRPEKILKESLIYAYFEKQCINELKISQN